MSNAKTIEERADGEARIRRIYALALDLTVSRLEFVDPKERQDNMAFDRVARTAQGFLRVADEAQALFARQQKEDAGHDQGADVRLPDEHEIDALEQRLHGRMARQDRVAERAGAEPDRGGPAAPAGPAEGGIA